MKKQFSLPTILTLNSKFPTIYVDNYFRLVDSISTAQNFASVFWFTAIFPGTVQTSSGTGTFVNKIVCSTLLV